MSNVLLDCIYYEVCECLWIHILIPSLVSKELRQVQCLLQEVTYQVIAVIQSLETFTEEQEEEEEEEEEREGGEEGGQVGRQEGEKNGEGPKESLRDSEKIERESLKLSLKTKSKSIKDKTSNSNKSKDKDKDKDKEEREREKVKARAKQQQHQQQQEGSPKRHKKGLLLNAPDYLFVSTQIAKTYPDLLESILVLLYQTYLPGEELSKSWRSPSGSASINAAAATTTNAGAMHGLPNHRTSLSSSTQRQKTKAVNSLFAPVLTVIALFVTYILMPIVAVLPTNVQRVLLRMSLSMFFYACWFVHRLIIQHPISMAVTLLAIVLIVGLIVYKIMVIDQQQLEALIHNVSPLPLVTGVSVSNNGTGGGRRGSALSATSTGGAGGGGGIHSRRGSAGQPGGGELIYTSTSNTPKNRSRSGTQTLTIDLNLRDDRVMSFDDYEHLMNQDYEGGNVLAMALSLHHSASPLASGRKGFGIGGGIGGGGVDPRRTSMGGLTISPPRSGRNSQVEDVLYPLHHLGNNRGRGKGEGEGEGDEEDEEGEGEGDRHGESDEDDADPGDSDEEGYVEEMVLEDHDDDADRDRDGKGNGGRHWRDGERGGGQRGGKTKSQGGDDSDSDSEQYGQVVIRYPSRAFKV
jgi:hypothetical protein